MDEEKAKENEKESESPMETEKEPEKEEETVEKETDGEKPEPAEDAEKTEEKETDKSTGESTEESPDKEQKEPTEATTEPMDTSESKPSEGGDADKPNSSGNLNDFLFSATFCQDSIKKLDVINRFGSLSGVDDEVESIAGAPSVAGSVTGAPVDDSLIWPSMQDLNTRLRRVITSYQRNYKKEELKQQQKAKVIFAVLIFQHTYILSISKHCYESNQRFLVRDE